MDGIIKREDALFGHISRLIDEAHKHVKTTVNTTMVYTYSGVGKYIVEEMSSRDMSVQRMERKCWKIFQKDCV